MENEYYQTKDLSEAGALIIKKQQLIRIDRDGRTCWFVFSNRPKCEKIANQFFFGEIVANVRDYYEALTRLKSRIFSNN